MPASAFRAWLVQMFEVAFSRRMCCSRVCSVSTKARLPSSSTVSPTMRPGIAAHQVVAAGHEAERRPAVGLVVAQRLALADGDVDAELAGRGQQPERDRVDRRRAPARRRRGPPRPAAGRSSTSAEEVRLLDEQRGRVGERPRRPRGRVAPPACGTTTTSMPEARGVGARRPRGTRGGRRSETTTRCRGRSCAHGQDHGLGGGASRRRTRRRSPRRGRSARRSSVWNSKIAVQRRPGETSGW